MKKQAEAADNGYIRPKAANELMKVAQSAKQTVYICGPTGLGKTSFAVNYLKAKNLPTQYYTLLDASALETIPTEFTAPTVVVADDLHLAKTIEERERLSAILEKLAADPNVWLILLSRAPVPAWLKPLYIRRIFVTISEKELLFSEKEEAAYLDKWDLSIMPRSAERLR